MPTGKPLRVPSRIAVLIAGNASQRGSRHVDVRITGDAASDASAGADVCIDAPTRVSSRHPCMRWRTMAVVMAASERSESETASTPRWKSGFWLAIRWAPARSSTTSSRPAGRSTSWSARPSASTLRTPTCRSTSAWTAAMSASSTTTTACSACGPPSSSRSWSRTRPRSCRWPRPLVHPDRPRSVEPAAREGAGPLQPCLQHGVLGRASRARRALGGRRAACSSDATLQERLDHWLTLVMRCEVEEAYQARSSG